MHDRLCALYRTQVSWDLGQKLGLSSQAVARCGRGAVSASIDWNSARVLKSGRDSEKGAKCEFRSTLYSSRTISQYRERERERERVAAGTRNSRESGPHDSSLETRLVLSESVFLESSLGGGAGSKGRTSLFGIAIAKRGSSGDGALRGRLRRGAARRRLLDRAALSASLCRFSLSAPRSPLCGS